MDRTNDTIKAPAMLRHGTLIDANRTASTSIKIGQYSFAANNANGIRNVAMKTNPPTQGMSLNIVRLYRNYASV